LRRSGRRVWCSSRLVPTQRCTLSAE
jgi:hypothetical protein